MWYESLPVGRSWNSLWFGYTRCGCGGIRRDGLACGACGAPSSGPEIAILRDSDGNEHEVVMAQMGAEGRYEDWVYLHMLEREWLRQITDEDKFLNVSERSRPSTRAIVILVFWTYFETKIERLLLEMGRHLPRSVLDDLLRRYTSIGSRLDRLYQILFSTTYWADLKSLGFDDVAALLSRVQERRNEFTHGHPEAISDSLVEEVIAGLQREHESWIAVFNARLSALRSSDA